MFKLSIFIINVCLSTKSYLHILGKLKVIVVLQRNTAGFNPFGSKQNIYLRTICYPYFLTIKQQKNESLEYNLIKTKFSEEKKTLKEIITVDV